MRTLDEIIEDYHDKLEDIKVPGTTFDLMDYAHGRCHIFAQVLSEELGYEMELLWDDDFWFDDASCPTLVLVHAYCVRDKGVPFKGKYIDARGTLSRRMIENEYECNSPLHEKYSLEKLNEAYQNKILEKPTKKELKAVQNYIQQNISNYQ